MAYTNSRQSRLSRQSRQSRQAVYVWELPVRFFHWINALAIVVLFSTGLYIGHPVLNPSGEATGNFVMGKFRFWHGMFAFIFMANLLVRLYWFWKGNDYAKLKLWQKRFWKDVLASIKYYAFMSKEHRLHVGHNALAQLMYFSFIWLGGFFMILTGLGMRAGSNYQGVWQALFGWVISGFRGEYQVRMLHHVVAWGFPLFLIGHLYMVFRQDILDDDGTVSSMISGYKYELEGKTIFVQTSCQGEQDSIESS